MTDDPTLDRRFLEELVRRADTAVNERISGTQICTAIGEEDADSEALVMRLINRGLVARTPAPRRGGDTFSSFDRPARPTAW